MYFVFALKNCIVKQNNQMENKFKNLFINTDIIVVVITKSITYKKQKRPKSLLFGWLMGLEPTTLRTTI